MRFGYFLLILALAASVAAQTTEFTYQGSLRDGANAAIGNYDFEFRIYDASSGGAQFGPTLSRSGVSVANGIFSVALDFGFTFPGPDRFLDIRVRGAGGGAFTTLDPRQKITTAPYAIRSVSSESASEAQTAATANNALALGGVAANQFVVTTDPRMTDARPPSPGSGSYIQNSASQQSASSFNISGNGTSGGTLSAPTVNASVQFNIAGTRALSVQGQSNLFVGIGAGTSNSGTGNTFVGEDSGMGNTTGASNTFVGSGTGLGNSNGGNNVLLGFNAGLNNNGNFNLFAGSRAGLTNSSGNNNTYVGTDAGRSSNSSFNTFVGSSAGENTISGSNNTFVGTFSGETNTSGSANAFFAAQAGRGNTTGSDNSFFGFGAGEANTSGSSNSYFGKDAGGNNTNGTNNSFFGASSGLANSSGGSNTFVGYDSGRSNSTGGANSFLGLSAGQNNTTGSQNVFMGFTAGFTNTTGSNNTLIGRNADVSSANLNFATAIGADAEVTLSNTVVLGRAADTVRVPGNFAPAGLVTTGGNLVVSGTSLLAGIVDLGTLGAAGSQSICRNASGQVSTCSSSLRYKTNFSDYRSGLELIGKLKPMTFDWKEGGMHDLGLGAEDVAAIEPLLVTYNARGEVEGVKYDRIGVVLVNAVKEQQKQIEELKALVCKLRPSATVCLK